jgi:hypothetical protein
MTPCPGCARHVRDRDASCPFCGAAVVHVVRAFAIGRVTRAAVFSAALVACGGTKDAPKPAAGSAEHLDQDFNQLLGSAEGSARRQVAVDASLAIDAAATADAGISDEERTRQLQRAQEAEHRRKLQRDHERELEEQREQQQQQWHHVPKPYGAPPARRRVV